MVRVEGLELRRPHELSGGQRQRVALARAIARSPRLLLLDEPFSAVDRSTRKRLYLELRRLHERLAATVLLVTHDLDEAAQLSSHLCLVRHGRLVQAGPTTEVLTRPISAEAARLLDIPNVFDGVAQAASGDASPMLHWGPHCLCLPRGSAVEAGAMRWAVLPTNVVLEHRDREPPQPATNAVPVRVAEVLELGAEALVTLLPEGLSETTLHMRLPTRAIRRHQVAAGESLRVFIRPEDVVPLARD
jgi:molybdate transport system ATP-binding protein